MDYYRYDSAPRTPSPLDYQPSYPNSKLLPSMNHPSIYEEDNTNYIIHPQQYWQPPSPPQRTSSAGSGSLLSELYDEPTNPAEWQQSQQPSSTVPQPPAAQQQPQRRATFPYVRQDHHQHSASSSLSPSPDPYAEPDVKIEDVQQYNVYPSVYHHPHHPHHGGYIPSAGGLHHPGAPHPGHHGHLPPHHQHHQQHHGQHMPMQLPQMHHGMPLIPPTMGISHPVQHTDDAASKETQFLRRRCFNCHTTEPPSWRRSTLNPGKIVCNKCGLYERTHLRPRPLRFDELRAGNKQRKVGAASSGAASPPTKKQQLVMARSQGTRRSSVSSGGASSDWDDNASSSSSVYSSPRVPNNETLPPLVQQSPLNGPSELPASDGLQLHGSLQLSFDSAGSPSSNGIQLPPNPMPMQMPPHQHQQRPSMQMHGRNKSHTFSGGVPPGSSNGGMFGQGSEGYEQEMGAQQMQRRGSISGV